MSKKHFIVPDCQVKPGVPLDHLTWAAKYCVEKHPDVIINLGDFADMESLSSYDKGKKSFEGRRYKKDIEVAKQAMEMFMVPIRAEIVRTRKTKTPWKPRFILCLGNHEYRVERATEEDPKLEGILSLADLPYADWEVIPYRESITVDGVTYSHYFVSGVMGRPVSSARALNTKKHCSCIMGHVQRKEVDIQYTGDNRRITSIFAGCYYQHKEEYLDPQTNAQIWHGCWMLHEVDKGSFDELPISLGYLRKRYGSNKI